MKTRKTLPPVPTKTQRAQVALDHGQVMEVLRLLQQKVMGSAALNGGFDTLMFKVEKIEEGQVLMGTKVDSIHDAIYHPDDGLFARVKDVEHVKQKAENVDKLERDVALLQKQAQIDEKSLEKDTKLTEEQTVMVKAHAEQLKDLVAFKARVCSIVKWGLVTIGGGLITGIGKLLYDFAQGHITVH